ncbi:MAG TPA: L-threonylcarbamoyladenylate synthase [Acidimicrobiales bacterium]|nr:L-threonylcarbamoyladenylate synthase [Acidimicrobiales bacterium]
MAADDAGARAATEALRRGGIVVVPTDTVYGLAARPDDRNAVRAVYRAKGRPDRLPLPVLAASLDQVRALGVEVTDAANTLSGRWWPGPLTLAFGFAAGVARPAWLDGRDEVAVRIPDHDFLRGLLEGTGPLLVTSANPHGTPTARVAGDVAASLGGSVDLIVDGGPLTEVPSTLVNVRGCGAAVEREGVITLGEIERALAVLS